MLAARAALSKQAMNHLLTQLEKGGYLTREADPADRRTRVVRLTERGLDAWSTYSDLVEEMDKAWAAALGDPDYEHLREGLARLEDVLDDLGEALGPVEDNGSLL